MVLMNGKDYIELDSVGTTLTSELMTFPQVVNEPPETISDVEEMMGVHLYDVDDEWFTSLSYEDLIDFFEFIENTNHLIAGVYNDWKTKIWSNWENVNNCYMNLEVI